MTFFHVIFYHEQSANVGCSCNTINWGDCTSFSVFRMFEGVPELCELANGKTAIWPVRRKSKDNELCKPSSFECYSCLGLFIPLNWVVLLNYSCGSLLCTCSGKCT